MSTTSTGLLSLLESVIKATAGKFLRDEAKEAVVPVLGTLLNLGADALIAGGPMAASALFDAVQKLDGSRGEQAQAIFAMAAAGHDLAPLIDQLQTAEAAERAAVSRAAADLGKVFRQIGEFLLKVLSGLA